MCPLNRTFLCGVFMVSPGNGSTEELEKFILGGGTDTGGDTSVTEKDESVREVKPTETTILNQVSPELLFLSHVLVLIKSKQT